MNIRLLVPAPAASRARRAEELDARYAILPFDERDQLAALLTDDVATAQTPRRRRHGREYTAGARLRPRLSRGLASARDRLPLPWPAPEALKFFAYHLWDPGKRADDPAPMAFRRPSRPDCVPSACSRLRDRTPRHGATTANEPVDTHPLAWPDG